MTTDARPVGTHGHYHLYPRRFHVGPFEYELVFVDGHIVDQKTTRLAVTNFIQQQILVSTQLPRDQRTHAVIQSLCHAWNYHFPHQGGDLECASGATATMVVALLKDLGVQPIATDRQGHAPINQTN